MLSDGRGPPGPLPALEWPGSESPVMSVTVTVAPPPHNVGKNHRPRLPAMIIRVQLPAPAGPANRPRLGRRGPTRRSEYEAKQRRPRKRTKPRNAQAGTQTPGRHAQVDSDPSCSSGRRPVIMMSDPD